MTATEDLARQLVGHERWSWRDGMMAWLWTSDTRIRLDANPWPDRWAGWAGWLPDLDDLATQGVLLGMLRGVCGSGGEVCTRSDELQPMHYVDACWGQLDDHSFTVHGCPGYPTLGEALARALLAAWGET